MKPGLIAITLALLAGIQIGVFAEEEKVFLKGKVHDSDGSPVGGAKIVIHNEDREESINGRSNGKGVFQIEHPRCSTLSFDVIPSAKSGLSSAHYSHVSGELSKYFNVLLHRGFRVTGRVMAEGQGVKGLEIKVFGQDSESGATVHGGGIAHTKGNGEYSFLLTPGKKTFQIKNDIYANLSPLYQHEFTITGDIRLPDMTLPLVK